MSTEAYIPTPRQAVIGVFGFYVDGIRRYRSYCHACNDRNPLEVESKIYGGKPGTGENVGSCDACGVTWERLSELCQRDHDEQQARWARTSAPTELHEMGCVSGIRCRVY